MALTQQKDIQKIIINLRDNSIAVKVKEYAMDEQGNKYFAEGKQNGSQCAFMPGQVDELRAFSGRQAGQEHDAAASMWTPEVVEAHWLKVGKEQAGLEDKPIEEWSDEDKERFNKGVDEKYGVQ
jgi:hypothetical protein